MLTHGTNFFLRRKKCLKSSGETTASFSSPSAVNPESRRKGGKRGLQCEGLEGRGGGGEMERREGGIWRSLLPVPAPARMRVRET